MIIIIMMIISTGGGLPAPDGPPVRHVSHYGDAPSPAVCQVNKDDKYDDDDNDNL